MKSFFANLFAGVPWIGIVEVAVLAVAFFALLKAFRGTRGAEILWGLLVVIGGLAILARYANLQELNWLLQWGLGYAALAAFVLFQPEIRQALAKIGARHRAADVELAEEAMGEIEEAVDRLSKGKIGALIAIERENTLHALQEGGCVLDAAVSANLLCTIFYPGTALHDGGVVISENRILRAGCMFPMASLLEDVEQSMEGGDRRSSMGRLGMRHRAALGLAEDTDALVVIVSEETGAIRVAVNRKLTGVLTPDQLHTALDAFFVKKTAKSHAKPAPAAPAAQVAAPATETETGGAA